MRCAAAFLFMMAALPPAAQAQLWPNETGPGGDLFHSSSRQFDRFWQAAPPSAGWDNPPAARPGTTARAPVPMLDWTPPPLPEAQPQRRQARPRARPRVRSVAASTVPAQPTTTPPGGLTDQELERNLATRERELESLRQRVDADRRQLEARRAATGNRTTTPAPATAPAAIPAPTTPLSGQPAS